MFKFFLKIQNFYKKEDKKIFSLFFILIKISISLLITLILPILFLMIFIFKEPREIKPLNQYLDSKIKGTNVIKNFNYKKAKISINKSFDLIYSIEDVEFTFNKVYLKFPKIKIKLKFINLIKKKNFINEIKIIDMITYLGYDSINLKEKKADVNLTFEEIEEIIQNILNYFYDEKIFFNKLIIENNTLYFFNKELKTLDKIELIKSNIKISKKNNNVNLSFNLQTKINNKNKIIESYNNCVIKNNKNVNCEISLNNLSIYNITKIFTKTPELEEYIKNVKGTFNLTFNLFLENYINVKDSNFIIRSSDGNFNLKQFFGGEIKYKNLIVNGNIHNNDHIVLNKIKAELSTNNNKNSNNSSKNNNNNDNNNINFLMSLELKKNEFLKMNFDINNANITELSALWPVFLNNLGIREWVLSHFKYGSINKAFAYMNFYYINNEFKLQNINSEVNISNTYLDYSDNLFPPVSNMDAKIIFTIDDMNIYINKANIENTKITNGKIYTNFNDRIQHLDINTESSGNVYEMFYFIENKEKNKIKNIVNNYVNGYAESKIHTKIPLKDTILLNDVLIDIKSKISNNNTFLFKNNSIIELDLMKKQNSNTFNINTNLKNSTIDLNIIDFVKEKNIDLDFMLDLNVLDNKLNLSNINIKNNKTINFIGNGTIENGILNDLYIYNIKYNDNDFNVIYREKDDNININVSGNKFSINKTYNLKNLNKNKTADKVKTQNNKKINFNVIMNNLTLNKKFNFKNTLINGIYSYNEDLENIEIITKTDDENNLIIKLEKGFLKDEKYLLEVECKNFGKLLSELGFFNKLLYGDLYFNGIMHDNSEFTGSLKLKNDFNLITKDFKNAKFFNYILNNEIVSNKIKEKLKQNNTMKFKKAETEIYMYNNIIKVKKLLVESSDFFGIGFSGKGKYYLNEEKLDFSGLIAPLGKINTLFGVNKIPFINKLLFGNNNAGLFTIGYTLKKDGINDNYNFNLIPISVMNPNSLKNLFLIFFLI